ncbi:beta-lactamase family protein (plasmid) [Paenibacillus rhizovicinus]|uniref:Beta-lactamase family protein n=1 Tax=Paenibacillus rhizovicinus TaxID=2704463 RepID=A0A6C0PA93_9BACL|nr:serine hydrolase domain-containing protein [Paenibacillus rhizovicinus]QHW35520.1 beta-lactamase family protein [Paenibacillus rhizovicinus]
MSQEERIGQRIDHLFAEWDYCSSPGAAVAVVREGQIVYRKGYGSASLEYEHPITPSTIFHVASISKQFTAFAIAMLAVEGKLSLEDDIRRYVSGLPDFGEALTFSHLIHHTSGLRDQWELMKLAGWRLDDVRTQDDVMTLIRHQKALNFKPGDEIQYCNSGYTLLAEAVKTASGRTLDEYLNEKAFRPLGMNNTHFHSDHRRIVPNRAYAYTPVESGGYRRYDIQYATIGGTGLFTTAEDLAKWMMNYDTHIAGGPEVMRLMHQCMPLNSGEPTNYAFGLALREYRGLKVVEHGGTDAGYRSSFYRFPDQRFGVIVLANLAPFDPEGLAKRIAEIYLADSFLEAAPEAGDANEGSVQAHPEDGEDQPVLVGSDAVDGIYYSEELDVVYRLTTAEDSISMVHRKMEPMMFKADRVGGFTGPDGTIKLVYEGGRLAGFHYFGHNVRRLWFRRW